MRKKRPGLIYNRVREFRMNVGLKQADVAQLVGLRELAIAEAERGKTDPRLTTKKKLAELFDTTIEYLFPVDEEGQPLLQEDVKKEEAIAA